MMIDGPRRKLVAKREHEGCRDAGQCETFKSSFSLQRTRGIHAAFCRLAKYAIPQIIQDEAVKVDRPTHRMSKHPIPGRIARAIIAAVAQGFEQFPERLQIGTKDGQVEIGVRSRLLTEQHVHAPTAVNPEDEAGSLEGEA